MTVIVGGCNYLIKVWPLKVPVTLKYNYIFRINSTHIEQLNGEIFVLNVALLSYIDLNLQNAN